MGMDHRAIVWCHGVLHQIRRMIWILARTEHLSTEDRLEEIRQLFGPETYVDDIRSMSRSFQVRCRYTLM